MFKIDLVPQEGEDKGWGKTPEEMDAFCKEHGFVTWFETSAKDNTNVFILTVTFLTLLRSKELPMLWSKPF